MICAVVTALSACSEMTYIPPDYGPSVAGSLYKAEGAEPSRGGEALGGLSNTAGDTAGSAGGQAGAGVTAAGSEPGGDSLVVAGTELSLSDWGVAERAESPLSCGELTCDERAECMSSAEGLRCVCEPRYEGDGERCEAQACPEDASGAPDCHCNEGYEGRLSYNLATRSWSGQCLSLERDCDEGERVQTSCGVGACRNAGLSRCEQGAWVEYCEPLAPASSGDLCDGLDEDCDGSLDEDFTPQVSSCGVGACAAEGLTSCDQGRVIDSCSPGAPLGRDSSCDRVDDDCDGVTDEGYATMEVSCGEGLCAASGRVVCEAGQEQLLCAPGQPTGVDDDCDGLDQDCDGRVDEGFVGRAVSCGVGACAFEGLTRCVNGVAQESCVPGEPAEDDSSCDGIDDDCDGRSDEDYQEGLTRCGLGACANTGRAWCEAGEELSECAPLEALGEDTSCDRVDDDCDGSADEAYLPTLVSCEGQGEYECPVQAETSCFEGEVRYDCEAAIALRVDESCDGVDDDCDGELDEAYVSAEVSCGLGVCADSSTTSCVDGVVRDRCVLRSPSGDDSDCDGRDDDCDGLVDEAFVEGPVSCGQGACATEGVARCVAGVYIKDCPTPQPVSGDERSCNGVDDDCDGRVDEAFISTPNSCGDGVCFARGSSSCIDGSEQMNCAPLPATGDDLDCDGLDNDCDASTDEDYPPVLDACGVGVCFNTADSSCVEGAVQNNCVELLPTGDDADCDDLDNDCDGSSDEDYPPVPLDCGVGVCATSAPSSCEGGVVQNNCIPLNSTGTDRDCDGLDNDCDAATDEGYQPETDECGVGVCYNTAASSCVAGQRQNNCVELPATGDDSVCNGLDDDCDGRVDEGYVATATTCVFGSVCVEQGLRECINGQHQDVCAPPAHFTGSDADCNNQDNDCDGRADEAFVGGVFYCGTGVCQRSGFRSCVDGVQTEDNCVVGPSNGDDSVCDGDDNDCDGRTDESFNVRGSSCGTGVCASTGVITCVGGSTRNSCREGDPTGDDSDNNGLDDDCDGDSDEDFVPPTPDTVCDGIDSDQDGRVDEAVPTQSSSCGEGVCASTGVITCVNGALVDSCQEDLSQQSADTSCNGVDNDCDGRFDEAYDGSTTETCGLGVCERQGAFVCSNGQVDFLCVEGSPQAEIPNNGIDEDCNGSDLTGPVIPTGHTINSTHTIVRDGSRFKMVWDNTGFNEAQAASDLIRFLTGQTGGIQQCNSYPNCSSSSYQLNGFNRTIEIYRSNSPYPYVTDFSKDIGASVYYFQDFAQTVVVIENSFSILAGPTVGTFIYSKVP